MRRRAHHLSLCPDCPKRHHSGDRRHTQLHAPLTLQQNRSSRLSGQLKDLPGKLQDYMERAHPVPPAASCTLGCVSRSRLNGQQSCDSLAAMMEAYAEEAVRIAADDHGMVLDYSSA